MDNYFDIGAKCQSGTNSQYRPKIDCETYSDSDTPCNLILTTPDGASQSVINITNWNRYNGQELPTVAGRYYTFTMRYRSSGIHGELHPKNKPIEIKRYHNPSTSDYSTSYDEANENMLLLDEVSPSKQSLYTGVCSITDVNGGNIYCNVDDECITESSSGSCYQHTGWITTSYTFLAQEDNEIIRVHLIYGDCWDAEGNTSICHQQGGGSGCKGICYDYDPSYFEEFVQ